MYSLIAASIIALSTSQIPMGTSADLKEIEIAHIQPDNKYLLEFQVDKAGCEHYGNVALRMAEERDAGKTYEDELLETMRHIEDMADANPDMINYVFLISKLAEITYIKYKDMKPLNAQLIAEHDCSHAMG